MHPKVKAAGWAGVIVVIAELVLAQFGIDATDTVDSVLVLLASVLGGYQKSA